MNECHWICLIGTKWLPDPAFPPGCPEEEHCDPPTHPGASGDKETTPCLPN